MTATNRRSVLKAVDLFCGAGGFSQGLAQAGFEVLFAADNWEKAVRSYEKNFEHPIIETDLSKASYEELAKNAGITNSKVDLIVGGPPCQGFSVQRIGDDHDPRNNLVLEFARLVVEANPRLFVMENVLGLLGTRGKPLLKQFLIRVQEAGYETLVSKVDACDYGVPQHRRRTIVAGWLPDECAPFSLPQFTHTRGRFLTVKDAFAGLTPPPASENLVDSLHKQTRMSDLNLQRIKLIPTGKGMESLPTSMRAKCHRDGANKIGHRYVYGRLPWDEPAGTITARFDSFTRGRFGHPFEARNMTLREGARLQTFPDDFVFVGNQEEIAAQIGNAVPPRLAESLAKVCRKSLTAEKFCSHQPAAKVDIASRHA